MFEIPGDVSVLDDDALAAAVEAALTEAREFDDVDGADLTNEQAERIVALADFVSTADAAKQEREQVATRAGRVEAARQVVKSHRGDEFAGGGNGGGGGGNGGGGNGGGGGGAGEGGERARAQEVPLDEGEPPADAGVVEKPKDTKPAQTHVEGEPPAETRNEASASTHAASEAAVTTPSAISRAAGRAPATNQAASRPLPALTAAADVPTIPSGTRFADLTEVGNAVVQRLKGYPQSTPPSALRLRHGAATFTITRDIRQEDFRTDDEMFAAAVSERRLRGGSLLAAGGWDAPSETLYNMCEDEGPVRGVIDLPEVTVNRGGVRYTKGPTLGDVLAAPTGFWNMTEAQVEAGTLKTALRPTEPAFVEQRLDAIGAYVQAGLLTRAAWPELVRRYVELAIMAHAYKRSAKILAAIETSVGAPNARAGGFGNALDLLHALELLIEGERSRLRLAEGTTMEVLLPNWVKAVIRADLSQRTGQSLLDVSDAQIDGYFALRGARVQYLLGWQEIPYAAGYPTGYPGTVTAIVYRAGTYVAGVADVITLDTIYDSTLLEENHYVALFMEEGILVANPCGIGKSISVPFVANGRTAAANTTTNLFPTA